MKDVSHQLTASSTEGRQLTDVECSNKSSQQHFFGTGWRRNLGQ